MQAVRIHRFGPPGVVVVEDMQAPSPGPHEVLVSVAAAGVAPWDALIREGGSKVSPQPPLTLGSDLAEVNQMIEIGATQTKRVFAFHEEEIALPQLLATLRALRITQDVKDDGFFRL